MSTRSDQLHLRNDTVETVAGKNEWFNEDEFTAPPEDDATEPEVTSDDSPSFEFILVEPFEYEDPSAPTSLDSGESTYWNGLQITCVAPAGESCDVALEDGPMLVDPNLVVEVPAGTGITFDGTTYYFCDDPSIGCELGVNDDGTASVPDGMSVHVFEDDDTTAMETFTEPPSGTAAPASGASEDAAYAPGCSESACTVSLSDSVAVGTEVEFGDDSEFMAVCTNPSLGCLVTSNPEELGTPIPTGSGWETFLSEGSCTQDSLDGVYVCCNDPDSDNGCQVGVNSDGEIANYFLDDVCYSNTPDGADQVCPDDTLTSDTEEEDAADGADDAEETTAVDDWGSYYVSDQANLNAGAGPGYTTEGEPIRTWEDCHNSEGMSDAAVRSCHKAMVAREMAEQADDAQAAMDDAFPLMVEPEPALLCCNVFGLNSCREIEDTTEAMQACEDHGGEVRQNN